MVICLVLAVLLLAFGWLVMTHVTNVATDAGAAAAVKAIETRDGPAPSRPGG